MPPFEIDEIDEEEIPTYEQENPAEEEAPKSSLQALVVDDAVDPSQVASCLHDIYAAQVASAQDEEAQERSALDIVVEASSLLIEEFAMVVADRNVLETIQRELDEYIFPRISLLYSDISAIQASDVAKLISFADLYNSTFSKRGLTVSQDRIADFEELATEYLRRGVHDQMHLMIGNSLRLRDDEDITENSEGHFITGHPEDVAFMIEMQLSVAREHLPARFIGEVLTACNQELFNMITDVMLDLASRWNKVEVERLCAIINDASRLIEQCDERNAAVLDRNNSEHEEVGDELCKELTELSLHATRFLCERVMLDLREPDPILNRVGGKQWESGNMLVIETTVATLKDYADDIQEWIPHNYYFPKYLKHCFDMTVQAYLESFFALTMQRGVEDPLKASQMLHRDWQNLTKFFCISGMAKYLGHAGHHSKTVVTERLGLLQAMSFLLTPSIPPAKLESEIKTFLLHFGSEVGIAAVLHMAGLRNRHIGDKESAEWHSAVGNAAQTLLSDESSKAPATFTLPDLRTSEYIVRVRVVEDKDESPEKATLNKLTQRPGLQQRWGASFRASGRRLLKSDRTLLSTWKAEARQEQELPPKPKLSKNAQSEYNLGGSKLAQRTT